MKRTHRILAVLLCLAVVLSALPVTALAEGTVAESGSCGSSATWTLTTDGTLTISGTGAMTDYDYYGSGNEAPWNDNYDEHGVKKVVVESGITHVGAAAFSSCGSLTSVTLPESVITIGDKAFSHCYKLSSITLPQGLTGIGKNLFAYCTELTALTIPSSVKSVGQEAFTCSGLTSLTVPNTVTSVGAGLFRGCESLTYAKLPAGITKIGESMFQGCAALGTYAIPSTVKEISRYAFSGSGLTSVTLPKALTTLGEGAFAGCEKLTAFQLASGNASFAVADGVLFNADKTTLLCFPGGKTGEYTIPSSVTTLPDSVFQGCSGLTKVTVPGSVKSMGSWVFMYCTGLKSAVIQSGITELGKSMFLGCSALTSISIPASVTKIGPWAFEETGFTSFTFPDTVKELGNSIFYQCPNLSKVTLPAGITRIPDWIFEGCGSLRSFTIPATVTELGNGAFARTGVGFSTLPANVKTLGDYVFSGSRVFNITIPDTVTALGKGLFSDCSMLSSVVLPGWLTEIPEATFDGSRLSSYEVPEGITRIGDFAFENCRNLSSVRLPQTLQELGVGVFQHDERLDLVSIPEGVTSVPEHTFEGCSTLRKIMVPASVTEIGMQAFFDCTALSHVYFTGTEAQFAAITVYGSNSRFQNATVHYTNALAAPTITSSGVDSSGRPTLKWNAVEGAHAYFIYRADTSTGTYTEMYATNNTSYTNTSANKGYTYYYKVCVQDDNGFMGPYSRAVGIKAGADLTAPTITLSGTNANGKPVMKWDAVEGASKYVVYRSTSSSGSFGKYFTTANTSFTNTSAEAGKTYYYKVCALDANSVEGPFSSAVSVTATVALTAPTVTGSNSSSGKPMLKWNAVEGAGKYVVYRATSSGGTYSKYYTATNTSFTNLSAETGKTYYYKVSAMTAAGYEGPQSAAVSVTARGSLAAPEIVHSDVNANGKPYLVWNGPSAAVKYVIYRSASADGPYSKYYTTSYSSFTNTSVAVGETYYYRICALDADGFEGSLSKIVSVTGAEALTAPVFTAVGTNANGKPVLKWAAVSGSSGYWIYRSTSAEGPFVFYDYTANTSFTNLSAETGKTYYYRVRACRYSDGGPLSEVVSVTATVALTVPTITSTGTSASGKPTLKWNAVEGAAQYAIYRADTSNGTYTKMFTTANTSYTNTSAKAGYTYYYKVCAVTDIGYEGPRCGAVSVTAK